MKVEVFKAANNLISLVVEVLFGQNGHLGKNKVVFILIERDGNNNAVRTLEFFLDAADAKVLCRDMVTREGLREGELFQQFKSYNGTDRGFKLQPEMDYYRVSLMNKPTKEDFPGQVLYLNLDRFKARVLANEVLGLLSRYDNWAFEKKYQ